MFLEDNVEGSIAIKKCWTRDKTPTRASTPVQFPDHTILTDVSKMQQINVVMHLLLTSIELLKSIGVLGEGGHIPPAPIHPPVIIIGSPLTLGAAPWKAPGLGLPLQSKCI